MFCRIQNLHISQTISSINLSKTMFCRIQNLHISQTSSVTSPVAVCFVEFKIYISLKHAIRKVKENNSFVEFKIYISLKQVL